MSTSTIRNQRGVVGLAVLVVIVLVMIGGAAWYVYKARTGQASTIAGSVVTKKATPVEIKKDVDALAADTAGQQADNENLDDLNVSEDDLK